MICQKCNNQMPDNAAFCPTCGNPIQNPYVQQNPYAQKPKRKLPPVVDAILLLATAFFVVIVGILIIGALSPSKKEETAEVKQDQVEESEEPELPHYEKEEFTDDFKYRDLIGNPEEHLGEKYTIENVYVFDVTETWDTTYYKCWLNGNPSRTIYIHDYSGETILDGDTIRVYGVFNGNDETKNYLTHETGETIALDTYYVDITEEAEE